MMSAFTKKDKAKTTRKDKSICFGLSKQNAIKTKQYITGGFIDHLFYLFVTFYSRQPVTANGLATCNNPSPHQSLSNVAGQWVAVCSGLSCEAGAFRRQRPSFDFVWKPACTPSQNWQCWHNARVMRDSNFWQTIHAPYSRPQPA